MFKNIIKNYYIKLLFFIEIGFGKDISTNSILNFFFNSFIIFFDASDPVILMPAKEHSSKKKPSPDPTSNISGFFYKYK